ncbi:MAG: hypothetical protein AB1324_01080 [Candidatus Micrarchaeota archaeon]
MARFSAIRARHLAESYIPRYASPEIERAFAAYDPKCDEMPGRPTLDELKNHPRAAEFAGLDVNLHVASIKGVTVEMSVTFLSPEMKPVAQVCWKAGRGVTFDLLDPSN